MNADTHSTITGVIYIPNGGLQLNSRSTMTSPLSLMILTRSLELNSNASVLINNSGRNPKLGLCNTRRRY